MRAYAWTVSCPLTLTFNVRLFADEWIVDLLSVAPQENAPSDSKLLDALTGHLSALLLEQNDWSEIGPLVHGWLLLKGLLHEREQLLYWESRAASFKPKANNGLDAAT